MANHFSDLTSRRQFLQATGALAAAGLPSLSLAGFHSSVDDTIQVALVGCGGRGGGAAYNALVTKSGPVKLVAMADVFADRLNSCYENLNKSLADKVDVPKDRQFIGFDGYKKAMDSLRPGDVVILTTPPAFRWVHFAYAIEKKLNVFMEKPVTTDGPTTRRMLALADKAKAAGLKVGVGLMSRHTVGLQELQKRVADGELGDILLLRGYRMHGPTATFESTKKPEGMTDLEYQIRRFHSFLWISGGCFSDYYIHHIDHLSWIKGSWPVSAMGSGGRHYRTTRDGQILVDQNFDSYAVEYTFADGTKFMFQGRCMDGAHSQFMSCLHGTKGSAIAARGGDCGGPAAIYDGQNFSGTPRWITSDRTNPYQNEWEVLMKAIRNGTPHNEVHEGARASLTAVMGRMASHMGQVVTWDQALNSEHDFAPNLDTINYTSNAPLMPGANGLYPVPQPGIVVDKEY